MAAYELLAAHNFRYKNHTQGVEMTSGYVRTMGNNELQKASSKKQGGGVYSFEDLRSG